MYHRDRLHKYPSFCKGLLLAAWLIGQIAACVERVSLARGRLSGAIVFNVQHTTQEQGMQIVRKLIAMAGVIAALASPALALAQTSTPASPPAANRDDTILLTIFFRHDQSKPLSKINQELADQGFYKAFPPPGTEVVSWYVMMGIGQVVTLRVPAQKLREVNRVIEDTAWGGYRTEFYPTYDYRELAEEARARNGK